MVSNFRTRIFRWVEGLNTFQGTYQFGFFAGITIETDYVTIDLSSPSISMDHICKQEWITPSYITIKNGES